MDGEIELSQPSTSVDAVCSSQATTSSSSGSVNSKRKNNKAVYNIKKREVRTKTTSFRRFQLIDDDARKAPWTVREKSAVLKALRRHGWKEIDKIAAEMPNKTREQIEYFIQTKKRQTKHLLSAQAGSTKFPIELWLEKAVRMMARKPDYSKGLPEALSLIRKHEGHTAFAPECRNLYEFMEGILRGEPPKELKPLESRIMLHLIQQLAALLRCLPLEEISKEINNPDNFLKKNTSTNKYCTDIDLPNSEDYDDEEKEAAETATSVNHVSDPDGRIIPSTSNPDSSVQSSEMICKPSVNKTEESTIDIDQESVISQETELGNSSLKKNTKLGGMDDIIRAINKEGSSHELFSINPLNISFSLLQKAHSLACETEDIF